jgi:pseudouridine synthase
MGQRERLNRFLARAGVASRRASDRLIQAGQVQVNGLRVDHPGILIDPEADRVVYNGRWIRLPAVCTYLVLNKPPGYLVSSGDPHHRRTVYDLLEGIKARVFPVGRLDLDTRGVLLLTDDGDLSYRLMHPRYGVKKTYRAHVEGVASPDVLRRLCEGVPLEGRLTAPAEVRLVETAGGNGVLELTLHEGRKRQVKRMCGEVGHPVRGLERIAFAGITTEGLEPGHWRRLSRGEVAHLKQLVGLEAACVWAIDAEEGHRHCD